MSVFLEVLEELGSMFFGTPRLSIPVLIVIALAAALAHFVNAQLAGGVLLFGLMAVLAENAFFTARKSRS